MEERRGFLFVEIIEMNELANAHVQFDHEEELKTLSYYNKVYH